MALYLVCDLADYNATTGECSAAYFTEQAPGSVLPPLTVEQGAVIGAAILLVWAVAWCFKQAARTLNL